MTATQIDQAAWRVGPAPANYDIAGATVVVGDEVVEGSTIVVRDGRIADVAPVTPGPGALDCTGLLVVPGLVDVHSDALERERAPRPSAIVPWDFALNSIEGRLVTSGVTTVYHGAAFQHQSFRGSARSVELAMELCHEVDQWQSYRVDHRILHRLDVLSKTGAATLKERLDALPDGHPPALVSHEDHTPGQGQYANAQYLIDYKVKADGMTPEDAAADIERLRAEGRDFDHVRRENLAWLGKLADEGSIQLAGHDPDEPEAIDALVERCGAIAEFPTTIAAARRARERGLVIVAGAPNLLRGGSHTGNVSAQELLAEGLLDALASDYLPPALLGGVWRAVSSGLCGLADGIRLVTEGPARAAGLSDRGAIAHGLRADFAVLDTRMGAWPRVLMTLRASDDT